MLRADYRDADPVRIASPLRAAMIFGRDNGARSGPGAVGSAMAVRGRRHRLDPAGQSKTGIGGE
jgi:hypothetical protein